jgi:hypothetical protein
MLARFGRKLAAISALSALAENRHFARFAQINALRLSDFVRKDLACNVLVKLRFCSCLARARVRGELSREGGERRLWELGNVIETHEHAGRVQGAVSESAIYFN